MSLKSLIDECDMVVATPGASKKRASVKLAVRNSGAIVLNFNRVALQNFGAGVAALKITCGSLDGQNFMTAERGSPENGHLLAMIGQRSGGHSGARCWINNHPFEPGVVHAGPAVETEWDGGKCLIACPDWDEILGEALAAERESESEDDADEDADDE